MYVYIYCIHIFVYVYVYIPLFFNDDEVKQTENPVGCTGKVKDEKDLREGYREDETVTAFNWVWR